jgi:hypothetical protein
MATVGGPSFETLRKGAAPQDDVVVVDRWYELEFSVQKSGR